MTRALFTGLALGMAAHRRRASSWLAKATISRVPTAGSVMPIISNGR